jgi:hypothetical protein
MCVLRGKLTVAPAARASAARALCASGYDFRTSAWQPLIRGLFAVFAETDATPRAFIHHACAGMRHSDVGAR